jgi:hypothetical protein
MTTNKMPALQMVGGDDVEESLHRSAKVELPGGFEAEVHQSINRNKKRSDSEERFESNFGPILQLERIGGSGGARVRVELSVQDWPAVKAAVESAIAKLAPEKQ